MSRKLWYGCKVSTGENNMCAYTRGGKLLYNCSCTMISRAMTNGAIAQGLPFGMQNTTMRYPGRGAFWHAKWLYGMCFDHNKKKLEFLQTISYT